LPRVKYERVTEGEWFRPTRKHLEMCCGCGMIHELEYKVVGKEIWVRVVKVVRGPRRREARETR
jgi:hypothetical protein